MSARPCVQSRARVGFFASVSTTYASVGRSCAVQVKASGVRGGSGGALPPGTTRTRRSHRFGPLQERPDPPCGLALSVLSQHGLHCSDPHRASVDQPHQHVAVGRIPVLVDEGKAGCGNPFARPRRSCRRRFDGVGPRHTSQSATPSTVRWEACPADIASPMLECSTVQVPWTIGHRAERRSVLRSSAWKVRSRRSGGVSC